MLPIHRPRIEVRLTSGGEGAWAAIRPGARAVHGTGTHADDAVRLAVRRSAGAVRA